jgi:hypothetical protein
MGTETNSIRLYATNLRLRENIQQADSLVGSFLAGGDIVRACHAKGSTNSSPASTADGTVAAAEVIADSIYHVGDTGEPMFGNTIRRAINAFRPLFRK